MTSTLQLFRVDGERLLGGSAASIFEDSLRDTSFPLTSRDPDVWPPPTSVDNRYLVFILMYSVS